MTKQILLLFCFTFFIQNVFSQTIKSKVVDANSEPLIGATILEKSTSNGTISDNYGDFSIKVSSPDAVLSISYIGHQTLEIKAKDVKETVVLEQNTQLNQLVIVGARNINRSATDTPAPVDILEIDKITSQTGQLDINQLLQFVAPSFNSTRQSGSDGTDHIDPASLRGLGPDQTLVLVNGKRRHQTSFVTLYGTRGRGNTGTDLNAIPAAAIERIEILRDGAAAQYGSDAIAGVINIVLKSDTEKLRVNANTGAYQAKYRFDDKKLDGLNYNFNLNYGLKVGNDGFVNLTADYNFRDHTNRANVYSEDLLRREAGDPRAANTSVYLNSAIPVSTHSGFYVFGGLNKRKGEAFAWTRFADDPRNIPSIYPNGFDPIIEADIDDYSIAAGYKAEINQWNLDISNVFGYNHYEYDVTNTLNASLGATSPTEFKAGGFHLAQNTINADLSRFYPDILNGFNLAFGAEFRNEKYGIFAGEEASYKSYAGEIPPGSQGFPGFQPSDEVSAGRNNFGVYVDTETDFSKKFMLGAAARFERYSDFGNTLNGKLGARYKFSEKFMVRSTLSSGFRAPSLAQIYFNSTITNFFNGIPIEVLVARNDHPVSQALGVPPLKQEVSSNFSLGFTARPTNTLSLTVDGYLVKIKDRVVLTGYFMATDPDIGGMLWNMGVGAAQFFTNAVNTTTKGFDAILSNDFNLSNGRLTASLAANFNWMDIDKINTAETLKGKEDTYFSLREQHFLKASAPPSKINLTLDYGVGKNNFLVRVVRFGDVVFAYTLDDGNPVYQKFSPKTTTDIAYSRTINDKFGFTVGSNNLFNVYPDKDYPSLSEGGGAWSSVQMGYNGAFYYAKLRFTL